jgi:predicted ferric reductase
LFMLHPLFLAAAYMTYSSKAAALFLLPDDNWTKNLGIISLSLMMSLLILAFYRTIQYQRWKKFHNFLGIVFFIGILHSFFVPSDISRNVILRNHMLFFAVLGVASYVYYTALIKLIIKRPKYSVVYSKQIENNAIEIGLKPFKDTVAYTPGQFVFLSFKQKGISNRVYPFSISSLSTNETLIVMNEGNGDYSRQLINLTQKAKAIVKGAFGKFNYKNFLNKQQIWIANSVGVIPFIKIAKGFSSTPDYAVDLYYSIHDQSENTYLSEMQAITTANNNFRIFQYTTNIQEKIIIDMIEKTSGDLMRKDFFLCGPASRMRNLQAQLLKHGIQNISIHPEGFDL